MSDPDQTVIATTVVWLRLAADCESLHPRMRAPLLQVAGTLEATLPREAKEAS